MFQEVRQVLDEFLTGQRSLRGLDSWVAVNLQRALDSHDNQVTETVFEIDADLIELGEGIIDRLELEDRLRRYLGTVRIQRFWMGALDLETRTETSSGIFHLTHLTLQAD